MGRPIVMPSYDVEALDRFSSELVQIALPGRAFLKLLHSVLEEDLEGWLFSGSSEEILESFSTYAVNSISLFRNCDVDVLTARGVPEIGHALWVANELRVIHFLTPSKVSNEHLNDVLRYVPTVIDLLGRIRGYEEAREATELIEQAKQDSVGG